MKDPIERDAAIDAIRKHEIVELPVYTLRETDVFWNDAIDCCISELKELSSAEPEPQEIGYTDCANAMLKMWIDNVLTDGEYYRIMDKLNAHWAERRTDAVE